MQSYNSLFTRYAAEKRSPREVATIMKCDLQTAKQRLREGRWALAARQEQVEQAAQIILHSGLSVPMVQTDRGPKPCARWSAWQDVALGHKQAA